MMSLHFAQRSRSGRCSPLQLAGAAGAEVTPAVLRTVVIWLNVCVSSELANRLFLHIRKRELMRAGDRVAVAVSGGADSVALLRLLLELRSELGVVLSVAHFNHRIRGTASDEDEQFVRDLAREHGLQFWYADADVPAFAREHKLSLEAAARAKRYEFFENIVVCGSLACGSADRIATAHTLDDQAETVLMRIIRGTGVSGLAGIQPRLMVRDADQVEAGAIVRPLLPFRRPDLEAYLRSCNQPWREDATNADLHHTRNRIRQLVIPLLEREFNPAIRERLSELAEIARTEEEYWNKHLLELMSATRMLRYIHEESGPWTFHPPAAMPNGAPQASLPPMPESVPSELPNISINCSLLLEQSLAEQRRFLRHATKGMVSLSYAEVDRILQLARGEIAGEVELARGLQAWCERDAGTRSGVVIVGVPPQRIASIVDDTYTIPLSPIGTTEIVVDRSRIRISSQHGSGLTGAVDITKLSAPELLLRPWRPGDRFWPQHSSGPKKVKELLTDKHITGPERKLWPVIACGDDIVWLRGFGVSQPFTADETATHAIVITEQSIES
jgi:tRNA(Ile)-lysidine synthase